uniref:Bridge-like lipid transfer protein family member 1 C-terminal domain-containing protein n=1 Tax=Sinocyclocheilus grahami TaxID=75366 RepID=A0A672MMB9_SINGR
VTMEKANTSFPSYNELDDYLTRRNSNFVLLLVATITSCGWIIYLTYYNSRNIGLILTLIINRLYKNGYIHIGSFSFSVLSGKVMFRDVSFINEDMSIRIQDGLLIFRWWKMYNPKQKQHDPKAETRLYVTVNGFEFHVYNRTDLYSRLQEIFGLEPTLIPPHRDEEKEREQRDKSLESVHIKAETQDPSSSWRSLIPVIKVNISTGRVAFGNHHLPQTLCMNFDDAFLTYATKPPSSHLDQFMHIVKGSLENVRVMLVPSPRYLGLQNDEPPRLMGEGFVVMQSNDVDIYYYQDEPGLVPEEMENGDTEACSEDAKLQDLPPCWGLDIVCGKGTDFNYGPWADRQRDSLWKFFLPADYQPMKASDVATPGKPRQILAFELRMNIIADATIDLLFTKNRETNAVHVNVGAGSYLEVNIPMTVGENGYSPTVKGQLLHIDASSSMQYRTLLEAEMLAFHVIASYPRVWNMPQSWQCEIEVYKATYHFIYAQKNFFTDLIKDWASDSEPDIYSFVPYSWKFKILFHQFEMIWAANQHNWIDCSTKQQENVYLAACGETLNIDFTLPFNDFVPTTCNTRFCLRAEDTDMRLCLPDCHPSRYPLLTLAKDYQHCKTPPDSNMPAEGQGAPPKNNKPRWRNMTPAEAGWVDCWSVPNFMLIIDYTWHPIYPQKTDQQLKQSMSEIEESMLSALRPPEHAPPVPPPPRISSDPSLLPPDHLHVEMELSPHSHITLYGPLLRTLVSIKENYFGEDDMYTDFEESLSSPVLSSCSSSSGWIGVGLEANRSKDTPHPLSLRPWDITVLINLHKVHGRLPTHCSSDGPGGPTGFLERLCFEMKKGYKETMLQLVLSPLHVFVSDNYQRPAVDAVLRDGHLSLSGLQMRAHAMFSVEGLPAGSDTLEYAWLIDVQAGALTGRVSVPQCASLLEWGESFVFHVVSREFQLEQPKPSVTCQHGVDRRVSLPGPCRTSEDLKYTMTRLTVDEAQVFIVEHGCAANIKTGALRLATCNLHTAAVSEGISAVLQDVVIAQFIEQQEVARLGLPPPLLRRSHWLEAGSVTFNLITADVALAADHPAKYGVQRQFLELHDIKTKRLWFLWPEEKYKRSRNRCGCLGGCRFFGGLVGGLDFFRLEEITPSSSSAFSSVGAESDMSYGHSLLHPGEWIVTKETPKLSDSVAMRRDTCSPAPMVDLERCGQHLSLHVPQCSHSSVSSSEENSSSSAALPLLAGERESPSPSTELMNVTTDGPIPEGPSLRSPRCSPLKRQSSVQSARLGSTKSLSAAVFAEKATPPTGVQFSSEVSRSDENVLDSPRQRRSYGSFPFTPSADSSTFHQYRSVDSSMSVADSEAYFSANEEFEPISSDEGPGTYPGRKRRRRQQGQPHIEHSRTSIYHSVEGPLSIAETRPPLLPSHTSQASFVSALGLEEEGSIETEKAEPGLLTAQPHLMACYQNYLAHYHVSNWAVKQPTNKRTSKSSLHRPLDLDTPTSEESSASFDQLSIPSFKVNIWGGLSASSLLDRGIHLMGDINSTPYTPLDKQAMDNTDEDTVTEDWTVDQPHAQTRTTAIVEVKGAVNVVLTPLVAEALDRYIESMVHFASIRHPASILDDLHGKVLNEVYQISKSTVSESHKISKTEGTTPGSLSTPHGQTDLSIKPDNVKIKGLQANVTVPKVNLCVLQASVEEGSPSNKSVTHVSLVALCFDRIATQLRMNRGIVEDTEKPSVMMEKFSSASKMAPQSSGSLRSNAGIEKGKEIAARLNIHRIHSQLRGLDSSDLGACAITAIPFEKSKVLFSLEENDDYVLVDETEPSISTDHGPNHTPDHTRCGASPEKWGWIMFECGIENLTVKGGRQSGAVLYSAFGVMGGADSGVRDGVSKSNGSSGSQTGSGYSTDVSDDNLPNDAQSPASEPNNNSDSDEQDEGVESDDLKKDLPLLPPPPDSSSMKLTIKEIWFSFAAPTNIRSHAPAMSSQLNLLSTATPAVGAWLVPIDELKSSLQKLDMEATLRVCAVMGCIMTEALEKKSIHFPFRSKYNRVTKRARYLHENPSCLLCNILHRYLQQADYSIIEEATMNDGLPALVTLRKGLVALARQWMKFIVVTQGFKAVGLPRPNQLPKPKEQDPIEPDQTQGPDCGAALQSDTSADGAEFEFDAGIVSEHTMLLEGVCSRPAPTGNSAPVTGVEIMRKLSKSHTHSESALRIKGSHPYQSLSYTSGDTAADSPAHVSRSGLQSNHSPRKESLLSYLTGSIHSLHNLLEATPHRANEQMAAKSSSLTRTGNSVGADVLTEHPLLSEPFSVSFYNWMSNAVGNRTGGNVQDSPLNRSQHNSLQTGVLPTIPSASDFNTVLSSDQNSLDTHSQHTHSQHSTSQDDLLDQDETNLCPAAVQLADAQVVFKPLLSHIGIQPQDAPPLSYKMYFGEHLSFSGTLECLRADIVDSDTSKDRKNKRAHRQGMVNLPPLDFKPALMIETFSLNAVILEKCMSTPPSASALSFHELSRRPQASVHCHFTLACQAIRQHVDMALVRLIHQFSTMIDDIKATQTDIKLNRYTAGSSSPTPSKARPYQEFRSSDFSRSSRGSLNGAARLGTQKGKRTMVGPGLDTLTRNREPRGRGTLGRSERRTSKVSRKGSRDVADHMTIQMDDSDSITVSEQSEPSAECWQNMYKLLNFYSLISDPTGILEKNQDNGGRSPADPPCHVVFESEGETPPSRLGRRRSLVSTEPQHVTLIVFGVGMVNRTHLEADIGGLTMEAELKKIHGSFTLKEKMKDILHQKMTETCASAHIGCVNIVLLEGISPDIQLEDFPTSPTSTAKQEFLTVVKCNIAKSQALYSAQRGLKTNNAAVFKVGAIFINIPQHPATLHSMMVRSSHQLSKQISDLIRQPSNIPPPNREDTPTPQPSEVSVNQTPVEANEFPQLPEGLEKKPIVLKFSAMLDGITIGAALLPSLKAEYKMGRMKSHGMTGAQTRFTFELPNHKLCFQSKVSPVDVSAMPPTASLTLPPVTMSGQYIIQEHEGHSDTAWAPEYSNYLQGNYLRCVAEIGSFEHNLTTDLLNHLVFLQKVFMKEVNEVIQKVSGGEQPIPLWNEHDMSTDGDKPKILLYSINLTFKGIQMTATTPSMRAVRFETGWIELELSNRVQCKTTPTGSNYLKLFGKCQVDLNLALGQIVKHQVYEEAGSDFHQVAYFRTRIGLRNALQEEISSSSGKEAVLITLNRPIVFAQPVAFDRAVLFWLNYKAAYDNWKEQRLALNSDIHMATKEVVDKLPAIQQTSVQAFSTLFLQLTVNDLGICLPITSTTQANHSIDFDTGSALVLTIESTLITACSSESLVSKGHFKNFCIRFAEGFETTWDDWKPEIRGDLVINACDSSAGTWTLNVLWKMCGIDVHMDPNIGKRLNALGNTLTSLTGEEDNDDITDLNSVNMADLSDEDESDGMSPPIHMESVDLRRQAVMSNQIIDARGRKFSKRLVDIRELNEQAKVIDDLKKLGASEGTINQEIQRYQHLESVAVNDIRRDVRKKLRRSSMRAASLKDKWGLGYKPSYNNSRSKSISATGRPPMKRSDRPRDDLPDIKVDAASPAPRVTFNIDTFPEETELDLLSVTIDDPAHYPSCSVFSAPGTPAVFSPTIPFQPDDTRRDDLSSTSSEDSDKDDEFDRDRPHSCYRRPGGSQRKSSALSALFSERWPATPPQRGGLAPPTERNIDFELDVRVEIDSGKCVLHPSTQPPEHEDLAVRRSCEQSSRSLDQESPPKKRKQQHSFASSSHLLNAKRVPTSLQSKSSDIETTVFYIPGVDVKLHYNSKMLKTESPNASRGSSLPRTLSKESKLYGMRDVPTPPASGPGKTNTLLHPPPPPLPSGTHSIPFWSSTAGFLHALSLFSVTGAWPTDLSSTVAHDYLGSGCLLRHLIKPTAVTYIQFRLFSLNLYIYCLNDSLVLLPFSPQNYGEAVPPPTSRHCSGQCYSFNTLFSMTFHFTLCFRNLLLSVHDNLATEKDCFQLCLEEPNIAFWTEAQKIWEDGTSDDSTYIVQTLDFHLGHNTMVTKPCGALESPMATITKVTRRRHENPPHGVATVKEWFNYVTAMRNEELNLLRNVDANNSESGAATKSSSLLSGFRGASSYNHETETIFALPKMQLQFKSIHVQDPEEPSLSDSSSKPKVECSVVTEFTDHICVTMDAELIMFLHDLVSAYLKEKEKALFAPRILASRAGQKSPTAQQDEASSEKKEEGVNYTTVDWREFLCNTWHLEPTLRLISWTGRKIDPVGVDYILQKLGFHHARTTIPKWLQRGVMDPLDKVLSVLIKKLGMTLQDEKEKKGQRDKDEH